MKTKLKQKRKRLFALMLSIVMALGMMPRMKVKAAETISTVSATTIPLLAGTNMKDVFTGVTFDDTKMTLDVVVIKDAATGVQYDSETSADTTFKLSEGKTYQIFLRFDAGGGYSFNLTGATINDTPAVISDSEASYAVIKYEYTIPEATVVQNVDITVTNPKSGETPNYTASVADAQKDMVSVSGEVYWGYGEGGNMPVASNEGIFVKEKEYTVKVTLEPGAGYKLTEDTVCTINGNPATFDAESSKASYQYPPLETELLQTVSATCNLIHGTKLSEYDFGIPEDANYEVDAVTWYEGIAPSAYVISSDKWETTTIDETKTYTLEFTLKAKEGYGFTDATTFTVNVPEEAMMDLTLDRTLKTKKIKVLFTKKVVGATNITLPLPVVGEPLPTAVSDNENCIVSEVVWWDGSTKITDPNYVVEADKTYVAVISLKPSARYLLWDTSNYNLTEISERITLNHENIGTENIGTNFGDKTLDYTPYMNSHSHDYAAEWSKDEDDHWHVCSDCGDKKDVAEHTYDAGKVTKEATETAEGVKTYTCTVCGMTKTEPIPAKGHSYSSEWSKDATSHWHACSCGDKKDEAEHTYDGGKVTKEPTETAEGVKTYTCTVCGMTKTEVIPATGKADDGDTDTSAPAVGEQVKDKDGKAVYKVTSADAKAPTVEYTAPVSKTVTTITIPATIEVDGITYKVTSIAKNAFKNNKKITTVTIGSNVKTIGANAFYGCTGLKTVTMGNSVTTIGTGAFYGCKKLTKVTLGKNVTTIGDKAFYKCTALTKITIPSKVSKIGKSAFYGCKKLKTITIKTTKLTDKKVGSNAFKGIHSKATITVPKSMLKVYSAMLKKKGIGTGVKVKK